MTANPRPVDDAPEMPAEAPTLAQEPAESREPPADPTDPWPLVARCRAVKANGAPCTIRYNLSADGLCCWHDPDRADEADEMRRAGGKTTGAKRQARYLSAEEIEAQLGALETGEDGQRWRRLLSRWSAAGRIRSEQVRACLACVSAWSEELRAQARMASEAETHEAMLEKLDAQPVEPARVELMRRIERIAVRREASDTVAELLAEKAQLEARIAAKRAEEATRPVTGTVALEPSPADGPEPMTTTVVRPAERAPVLNSWLIRPRGDEDADAEAVWRAEHPGQ